MVLSIIIATAAAPGLLGTQEAIRQSQSKEKREEHRARRCNLIATCVKSSLRSREINGRPIVLKDGKLYIDTGTSDGKAFGHPFGGYYLPYPDTKYEGLVTTITDEVPMMNWVYVDKETYEVKYGVRANAQDNLTGPFDVTRQDRRLTFDGWEGWCAVEEFPTIWALYFDKDDDGLRSKVAKGTRILEVELARKEKRWKKEKDARQEDQTTKREVDVKQDEPVDKPIINQPPPANPLDKSQPLPDPAILPVEPTIFPPKPYQATVSDVPLPPRKKTHGTPDRAPTPRGSVGGNSSSKSKTKTSPELFTEQGPPPRMASLTATTTNASPNGLPEKAEPKERKSPSSKTPQTPPRSSSKSSDPAIFSGIIDKPMKDSPRHSKKDSTPASPSRRKLQDPQKAAGGPAQFPLSFGPIASETRRSPSPEKMSPKRSAPPRPAGGSTPTANPGGETSNGSPRSPTRTTMGSGSGVPGRSSMASTMTAGEKGIKHARIAPENKQRQLSPSPALSSSNTAPAYEKKSSTFYKHIDDIFSSGAGARPRSTGSTTQTKIHVTSQTPNASSLTTKTTKDPTTQGSESPIKKMFSLARRTTGSGRTKGERHSAGSEKLGI